MGSSMEHAISMAGEAGLSFNLDNHVHWWALVMLGRNRQMTSEVFSAILQADLGSSMGVATIIQFDHLKMDPSMVASPCKTTRRTLSVISL
jgi:hypothetical protein